jgi:trans-2,3-dihydro-3-hydroxyanthranilate isomerase
MAAMRLRFDIVDVFTDRPFAGNQLAVVHGADALSTEQCLALAQEFGFSETTFPAAPSADGTSYGVRIFTPAAEIPFAGHPTLGTAWVLREQGLLRGDAVTQVCGAGEVGVRFDDPAVELSVVPRDEAAPLPDDVALDLLADLGLEPSDLDGQGWVAGCGLTFVHLPVWSDAVSRARVMTRPLAAWAERLDPTTDPLEGVAVVSVEDAAPDLTVRSRVFVPGLSVPEDPATGSAAAGLGLALVAAGLLPEGGRYDITQGVEMGRPSRLRGRVDVEGGRAVRCHVAGEVHAVASGEVVVPPVS